jgi:hypothetical protein
MESRSAHSRSGLEVGAQLREPRERAWAAFDKLNALYLAIDIIRRGTISLSGVYGGEPTRCRC